MCVYIRSVSSWLLAGAAARTSDAVGVLLFLAQMFELPSRARVVEASLLASLLSAPMDSIMATAIMACTTVARRCRYVPIAVQAQACLWRFALSMEELDVYADRLRHARGHAEALHLPPNFERFSWPSSASASSSTCGALSPSRNLCKR